MADGRLVFSPLEPRQLYHCSFVTIELVQLQLALRLCWLLLEKLVVLYISISWELALLKFDSPLQSKCNLKSLTEV